MGNKAGKRGGGQALGTAQPAGSNEHSHRSSSHPTAPRVPRQVTNEEERRKRAEAMEKKMAKQKARGTKSKKTKAKENWETYKKLDKVTKEKASRGPKIQDGVLNADTSSSQRSDKSNLGPQSAIFNTRA
eukprot:CAMPEP_0184481822 /NCGR_PEP_ID=MMETSP0113_2-20130426/3410_1 /TAXON_ID=91329 /ORGANISM="Norrisiella sphaerica, Strain BC52" /LENGTH=129 /DNA_ID=CAMNT_0026861211 /DNA_START=1 /DNA_END=390 /DNA_ORIENTATION=-